MSYYPYGEERTTTANNRDKFGTYWRDDNGLDYAWNRYHQAGHGRFLSPDPNAAGAAAIAPQSWNRYMYVTGDPINLADPTGLVATPYYYVTAIGYYLPGNPQAYSIFLAWALNGIGVPASPEPEDPTRAQSGNGTNPGRGMPNDVTTDKLARGLLLDRLNGFEKSNCNKVLTQQIKGYNLQAFRAAVNTTEFYNVNSPGVSGLTQNQVVKNGNSDTLKSSVAYGITGRTTGGNAGVAVLLGANFFSNSDATYRSDVLLHELMHAFTNLTMGDPQIFDAFKSKGGLTQVGWDTENISAWLSADCKSTPTGLTWWIK